MSAPVSNLGAICLAIAGFTLWVLCDSAIKLAGQSQLPNYEIVAFLGFAMAGFIAAYCVVRGKAQELWPNRPKRLMARALFDLGNNLFIVIALRHLSLTLFYILVFTSPMIIAVFGRLFLKERLPPRKASAILVGFLGVVIAVDPLKAEAPGDWVGYGAVAICVACFSASVIWSRIIVQSERAESMAFFSGLVTGGVGLLGVLVHYVPIHRPQLVVLLVMGLLCSLGSICIFVALRYATVATVSQFHYSQLIAGALVSYLLFHEPPTSWMLVGAALIIASGMYVAIRVPE